MRTIGILLLAVLGFSTADAQMEGPPGPRAFERVEQWRKVRMVDALDLSEDQAARLFVRMNEAEKQRRELMREKGELLDRIEELLDTDADSLQLEKVLSEAMTLESRMYDTRVQLVRGLRGIISLEQRARFFLFERRFERELREAMREVQRRRHPRSEP